MSSDRPGFANERTALGWQRCSLSLLVIGALMFGHAVHRGQSLVVLPGALAVVAAAWAQLRGRRLYLERRRDECGVAEGSLRTLTALIAAVSLLAAVVLVAGG
jgi:uncharacterized membrane protein YidH (DUF202 family)